MKESVTKFDLEAAFKALDEIDVPVASKGIKANKPALTEIFSRKSKFDALMEEYYDIGNTNELADAKDARDAEIAKAKLARIEKIVDLDAKSPEDLLTSYVGKFIMQCPQCMTLFYKNPEDIEESEDDSNTVNVNEICQHCGNDSGYTLVGKVGEVAQDEMDDYDTSELDLSDEEASTEGDELTIDVDSTDESDDIDLDINIEDDESDAELDVLDLESDEEQEEPEKKEEAFNTSANTSQLLENLEDDTALEEAVDLEVSDEDFKKLISSPEFKKPISDSEVRAMMHGTEDKDTEDENKLGEALTEGDLGLLGKTIGKKLKQTGKKLQNKASDLIDKFADDAMTREEKADYVLTFTMEDSVKDIEIDQEGKPIPNEQGRKFDSFAVLGYKGYFSTGKPISSAPAFNDKGLVLGMSEPQIRSTYKEADELAKGWSLKQGYGPAYIFLIKNENLSSAAYLCSYFKGSLENDKLEEYFKAVKDDIKAKMHIKNGGGLQDENQAAKTEEVLASKLEKGSKIVVDKDTLEVVEISKSRFGDDKLAIKIKDASGSIETINVDIEAKMTILSDTSANESFNTKSRSVDDIMENIDVVDEQNLEEHISNSLINMYKNVAGFRITDCSYLNEKLQISGKAIFTSGKSRQLVYTFTEAKTKNDKLVFVGLNEKLGKNNKITLIGHTSSKDNKFITEAFTVRKK